MYTLLEQFHYFPDTLRNWMIKGEWVWVVRAPVSPPRGCRWVQECGTWSYWTPVRGGWHKYPRGQNTPRYHVIILVSAMQAHVRWDVDISACETRQKLSTHVVAGRWCVSLRATDAEDMAAVRAPVHAYANVCMDTNIRVCVKAIVIARARIAQGSDNCQEDAARYRDVRNLCLGYSWTLQRRSIWRCWPNSCELAPFCNTKARMKTIITRILIDNFVIIKLWQRLWLERFWKFYWQKQIICASSIADYQLTMRLCVLAPSPRDCSDTQ